MTAFQRVKHWGTFAQTWHLYDAKWQNPFDSALEIIKYLKGYHKPMYHPLSQCEDHVVVINTKDIAFPGQEWKKRVYFHHTTFHGGASYTMAWELHKKDPTMIIYKAVYNYLGKSLARRHQMKKLHLYPGEEVPPEVMQNITHQIRQLRPVPRRLDSYSEKEIAEFPKLFDFDKDYIRK